MEIPEAIRQVLGAEGLAAVPDLPGNKWPAGFRELPDDALIRVSPGFRDRPYRRHARTPAEFREVLASFPGSEPRDYEDDIEHERQHAAVARALGCASRFALAAAPLPFRDDVWYVVPGHTYATRPRITKLAVAAIAAAPSRLSDGDLADLHRMGVQGTLTTSPSGSSGPGSGCRSRSARAFPVNAIAPGPHPAARARP